MLQRQHNSKMSVVVNIIFLQKITKVWTINNHICLKIYHLLLFPYTTHSTGTGSAFLIILTIVVHFCIFQKGSPYDIYSRAMKTQHPNVHQYLKDILNILSQRISGDLMNTKDRHHIDRISFNVKCPNVYTHLHFQTIVKLAFSESIFAGISWLQYHR